MGPDRSSVSSAMLPAFRRYSTSAILSFTIHSEEDLYISNAKCERKLGIAKFSIVALMVLFSLMSYFDRTIMSVAGPGIIRDFGISGMKMVAGFSAFLL